MLENQIYTIEAANINQETLQAMRNAGKAMKDIHGNIDINKVDTIMYAFWTSFSMSALVLTFSSRPCVPCYLPMCYHTLP